MTSRLNRRQRRQVEAIKKRVRTTRINKLVAANEESIQELEDRSESFLRSGIDPKRVDSMKRRLENTVSRARDLAAKTEEFIRSRVDSNLPPETSNPDAPRLKARLGPIAGFSMTDDLQAAADNLEKERRADRLNVDVSKLLGVPISELLSSTAREIYGLSKNVKDFDALLAAWGRLIWENAKDSEDYDGACRKLIASACEEKVTQYLIPEALMFSSVWAVDAFQRITTTHTFAAALMCSDPDRGALEGLEKQWRAFMIILPDNMLVTRWVDRESGQPENELEMTRILVSVDDASAKMTFCFPVRNLNQPVVAFEPFKAPTFADLLLDDPQTMTKSLGSDRESYKEKYRAAYEMDMRTARMAQRLVAGLLLAMQNTENFKDRAVEAKRSKNKRAPGSPAHRLIHVGRPLNIDLRPNIENYIRTGKTGTRRSGPPTVQVLVRGHYKRQAYGVGRLLRKVIWIEPFWRGPEEAIINVRPKLKAN
jgi:hypothetical protein